MKPQIERRSIDAEFRVADENGKPTVFGYAAKFNARSSDLGGWYEQIDPNAFNRCLASNPSVKGLFNHDANYVLGSTDARTMTLRVDGTGLQYQIDPPDTQWARDLITSMKRGDINQSSFGFICLNATWSIDPETGCDLRTVLDADLFDASVVTYPAYPQATSGVRSFPADMPTEVRSKLQHRDITDGDPLEGVDVVDGLDDDDCECDCSECVAGNCCDCSDPDCDDPNCICDDDEADTTDDDDSTRSLKIRVMLKSLSEF